MSRLRLHLLPPCAVAFFALAQASVTALHAAEGVAADRPVALPPFLVEEAVKGPPWRYAQMPGYEILARCPDDATRTLAGTYLRLHQLLALMVPESLQIKLSEPRAIIFYDQALQPAASQEVIAKLMESKPAGPPPELQLFGSPSISISRPVPHYDFLPNLRLWDRDAMTVFTIVQVNVDADQLSLTADYIGYLLRFRTPALPAWFVGGVMKLYELANFSGNELTLRPLKWIAEPEPPAEKNKAPPPPRPAVVLPELLANPLVPRGAEGEERLRRWTAQAALFIRWALDERNGSHREALEKFVDRVAVEAPTEAVFQECFGLDFATAQAQLTAYLPDATRKTASLRPAQAIVAPPLALRNATEVEISRIKGDWERLEIGFVKQRAPELQAKYLEQARRTLLRAYDHGQRDAGLLAVLGLCECDAGNDAAARKYLEEASRLGPIRPRASFELARLRFAAAQAEVARSGGKLNTGQTTQVLTPLFAARAQPPPQPEVYELIAEVWGAGAVTPTRGHLAVLREGVALFPRRVELVYRTAALYALHGFPADATALIGLGLKIAADETQRARFTALEARLSAPVPAAKSE